MKTKLNKKIDTVLTSGNQVITRTIVDLMMRTSVDR